MTAESTTPQTIEGQSWPARLLGWCCPAKNSESTERVAVDDASADDVVDEVELAQLMLRMQHWL